MRIAWLSCFAVAALMASDGGLSVSINGAAQEVRSGAPLLISATLAHSDDASWAQAVTVGIKAEDGSPITFTLVLRSATASNGFSRALWTVSPDDVRSMAAGQYVLRVGEERATFRLTLQEATTDEERERDLVLQARFHVLDGRMEQAMTDIGSWLGSHPASVAALVLKADLHESAGQWKDALDCISRAMAVAVATDHGPIPLLRRQARLLERQ